MKNEELMIGDWVSVSGTNMQVAALGRTKAGFLDEKSEMFFHEYDNIHPIPLTDEILEKNGFEYMIDEYGCWMMGKVELLEREPYNGLFEVEIHISKETIFLHYVHKLQHALRLCGIERRIEP